MVGFLSWGGLLKMFNPEMLSENVEKVDSPAIERGDGTHDFHSKLLCPCRIIGKGQLIELVDFRQYI